MTIPPTKAQIDTALATPANANALLDDFRKAITDPSVIYPEMFGAVEIERGDLPGFDPDDTKTADTAALATCMTQLGANGGTLLLRRPYGLTAGLTLTADREGVKDGQRIIGTGTPYSCGLQMTSGGYDAITLRGTTVSGGTKPIHPYMENFFVKGGATTGKGIYAFNNNSANSDCRISNAVFKRLLIFCGGDAFDLGDCFQTTFDTCKVSSHKGHGFNIEGGNATNLQNCYASIVGRGKAGYRIVYMANLQSCTGLDDDDEINHWAIVGGRSEIEGALRTGGSTTIVRIAAGAEYFSGEFDGLQLRIVSGTHSGFEGVIDSHVVGDGTHGNYVLLSTDTPLPSSISVVANYEIRDAESRRRGNADDATNRAFRGIFQSCNIELWGRSGIRAVWWSKMKIDNCLFYDVNRTTADCCIFLQDTGDGAYGAWNKIEATKFDMSKTPRFGHQIIQAHGTAPVMSAENMSTSFDSIYSLEAAADLQMLHHTPRGIILPTGFATSSGSVDSRGLYLNSNVLTMKP